jgi:hypothetical protein
MFQISFPFVWHEILGAFNQDISYCRNETIAVFFRRNNNFAFTMPDLRRFRRNCELKITILCFKNLINDGCFNCRDKVAIICVKVSKDVIEMC